MQFRTLETLIGRTLGVEGPTLHDGAGTEPSARDRRAHRPKRSRLLTAGVFIAVLGATALYSARSGSNAPPPSSNLTTSDSTARPPADTSALRSVVADAESCSDRVDPVPTIECTLDGSEVEYRLVGTGALVDAYRARVGTIPQTDRRGPAQCAAGHEDERAWSRPSAPREPAGRYRCVIEQGRAEMWWTDDTRGLLAHARAADDDLARLFAWWQDRGP
jgi:hypothetical protein